MDGNGLFIILALVILTFLSAFFSASETAFSCLNKARLKSLANAHNIRAERALALSDDYDTLITTILVGNNIVNILSSSLATLLFIGFLGDAGVSVSTVVMTVVILIFGEISPKTLAREHADSLAMRFTPALSALNALFKPLNWALKSWRALLNKIFKPANDPAITEEELLTIVDEAESDGGLDQHESELIRSAIEFNDLSVSDILTPRVDVIAVEEGASDAEIDATFREQGFSRLPVYREQIDNIIGILHERDFYANRERFEIGKFMTPVACVTPTMKLSALLRYLQKSKTHMAVVTDEYGGTSGIVTMEDILEELVGEIWDEHDEIVEDFVKLPDGSLLVNCAASLDKMLENFGIEGDYDSATVSGWVNEVLGRVADAGDEFDYGDMHVIVTNVENRRVQQIRVFMKERATA